MLNSSAIGTTNRNLLAVLGDGLRIPARFRAGENGTPSAKVGSSREGDPGKLGSCDDYWQRVFSSLPTRASFGRGLHAVELDPTICLSLRMARPSLRRYCRIQRFCRLIAGRPTSSASEEVSRRSISSLRTFISQQGRGLSPGGDAT